MESDYEKDLAIDPDALDTEWLVQPTLTMRYAECCADARLIMDRAEEVLDLKRAELDADIRNHPQKYGVAQDGKLTEARVSGIILQQSSYQATTEKYLIAKYDMEVLSAAVKAFDHRKAALENLVRLQGQGYFAGPMAPRDLRGEYQKRAEMIRQVDKESVRGRMKARLNREEKG